jgi:hypothetical protein
MVLEKANHEILKINNRPKPGMTSALLWHLLIIMA